MNENEIKLSKEIESMAKKNDEDISLTRKMIGNVEAALTERIEKSEKDLKQVVNNTKNIGNLVRDNEAQDVRLLKIEGTLNLRLNIILFPMQSNIKGLKIEIDKLRSDNHNVLANHLKKIEALKELIEEKAQYYFDRHTKLLVRIEKLENKDKVLEKSLTSILEVLNEKGEEKIHCPKCSSTELDTHGSLYLHCKNCGAYFYKPIEKEIRCPVCDSNQIEKYQNTDLWHCKICGLTFSDEPIEDKTELQKEIEGLTFNQLTHRFVKQRGAFATFQDSLIYIDWLYREIISDLQFYINNTDLESGQKLIEKYKKLFKEK